MSKAHHLGWTGSGIRVVPPFSPLALALPLQHDPTRPRMDRGTATARTIAQFGPHRHGHVERRDSALKKSFYSPKFVVRVLIGPRYIDRDWPTGALFSWAFGMGH